MERTLTLLGDVVQRAMPTQPSQRTSARRQPRVDLSRLDAASLRKYRRVYKLGELAAGVAKEDLVPAVLRHWQSQVRPPGAHCVRRVRGAGSSACQSLPPAAGRGGG
jgi:hypothetical protein